MNWPQSCSSGDGEEGSDEDGPSVEVCFDVSTTSTSGDADGDGLLDGWERNGYNADGYGGIEVDLPASSGNPKATAASGGGETLTARVRAGARTES
ncbi:hypothetical protein ACFXJJ_35825, partial [Streptomyces sp. NPDC059233]